MRRIAGDHLLGDPLDYFADSGFVVERVERSRLALLESIEARAI